MEMNYDVDFHHQALGHKQARVVVNQDMPQECKPSPKKGKASTGTLQYPMQAHPCAEGCVNFSKRGSSATHEKLTCIVCGHSTTTARQQVPRLVYDQCPHANTDFRGSGKNTHRMYCLDICNAITEMRQAVYKGQNLPCYSWWRASTS